MKKQHLILIGILSICAAFLIAAGVTRQIVSSKVSDNLNGTAVVSDSAVGNPDDATEGVSADYEQRVATASAADEAAGAGTVFASKQALVVFKAGTTVEQAEAALGATDTIATKTVSEDDMNQSTPVVTLQVAEDASVADAVAALAGSDNIAIAQPNYIYHLMDDRTATSQAAEASDAMEPTLTTQSTSINDPFASSSSSYYQWQLSNYVSGSTDTGDLGINAFEAWDYVKCNHMVGVAVIDTGCLGHPRGSRGDIVGAYNAYNAINGGSTTDVADNSGHGTHVCGIIGAKTNNGKGGSGVTYNAYVMPVKACDDNNGHQFYDSELVKSYQYVIQQASTYNIRVINMSLGGVGSTSYEDTSTWEDYALMSQIDAADAAGILTVCAAGNYNSTMPYTAYPADYTTCMSVINLAKGLDTATMTNSAERDYGSSNYNFAGHKVKNISAPGTDILSTSSSGGYVSMSGTSMASPVAAGTAALVFAANESLTPTQCKDIIYGTARDLVYTNFNDVATEGWDVYTGYGEVNAAAAVKKAAYSGWKLIDGSYYYYSNGKSITGWVVTSTSPTGDDWGTQRYWLDSDGKLVQDDLITDAGYYAYATPYGYVVRGVYTATDGTVYFADNDGRLLDPGWTVSSSYGQGTQRYWIDSDKRGAVPGAHDTGSGWTYVTSAGYVLRGVYTDDSSHIYLGNNDGVLAGPGWTISNAYGQGTQRYWIDSGLHYATAGEHTVDSSTHTYVTSAGYVLRGVYTDDSSRIYLGNNDGVLAGPGWTISNAYGQGTQRYWIDSGLHYATVGEHTVDSSTHTYVTSAGYVLRGVYTDDSSRIYLGNNDGVLAGPGWTISNAYGQGTQRYWIDSGLHYATAGEHTVDSSTRTYVLSTGYVLRGVYTASNGTVYRANNDGVLY